MTVGSLYTIAELRDLLAAKDVELKALADAIAAFDPRWRATDPSTEAAWQADYQALRSRYSHAELEANAMIAISDLNPVPANLDTTGDVPYRDVLSALQKTSGLVSPGDFQDLWNRLTVAQNAPIAEPPVPQPAKGSDATLNAIQWIDRNVPKPTPKNLGIAAVIAAGLGGAILASGGRSTTVIVRGGSKR